MRLDESQKISMIMDDFISNQVDDSGRSNDRKGKAHISINEDD